MGGWVCGGWVRGIFFCFKKTFINLSNDLLLLYYYYIDVK